MAFDYAVSARSLCEQHLFDVPSNDSGSCVQIFIMYMFVVFQLALVCLESQLCSN